MCVEDGERRKEEEEEEGRGGERLSAGQRVARRARIRRRGGGSGGGGEKNKKTKKKKEEEKARSEKAAAAAAESNMQAIKNQPITRNRRPARRTSNLKRELEKQTNPKKEKETIHPSIEILCTLLCYFYFVIIVLTCFFIQTALLPLPVGFVFPVISLHLSLRAPSS